MAELLKSNTLSFKAYAQYCLFALFVFDIFFLGSGMNYAVMGLGTRKIIFAIFALVSFFIYIDRRDQRFVFTAIQAIAFLLFAVVWMLFLPIIGHGDLAYSFADALPLVAIAIFIITKDFSSREGGWVDARRLIFYSVILFSFLHVFLYVVSWLRPDLIEDISRALKLFWEPEASDIDYFVFLTPLDNGLQRVYFGSSFLLFLGLYFALDKVDSIINTGKGRFFVFALVVLALWATNTRSLLFGAFVFIVFRPVFNRLLKLVPKNAVGIFLLVAAPFFLSFFLAPTVDPQMLFIIGVTREGSDDLRSEQLMPLVKGFLESPFFGRGFGGSVQFIRSEEAPYSYELSIVALFMKLGLIGFVFSSLMLTAIIYTSASNSLKIFPEKLTTLYSLYFSYILSCFYNPYMFGFFGTFFSLFLLYEFTFLMRASRDD